MTLHVRLIDGEDSRHVLEAIFKALGAALGRGLAPPQPKETSGRQGDRPHRARAGAVPGSAVQPGREGGGLVFVAGQLGLKPGDKELVQGIAEQTEQVLQNLRAILEEAGSGLDRLVKTTVFLQNLGDFAAMNEVYAAHVGDAPPARSTVEVAKLPSGALVEIEAVALL